MYLFLADLVLFFHFIIAVFIVAGLILILIGGLNNWHWIRNPWFRYAHLLGISIIVLQAWFGRLCPLTYLENSLRQQAGDAVYPGSFVAYWIQELLYYNLPFWVFTVFYTLFAVVVVICWIKFRPYPFKSKGIIKSESI